MAPEAAEPLTPAARAGAVKARAIELGFAAAGVTDTTPTSHADALRDWLDAGMAGTMAYMARQARKRMNPKEIMEDARSIVVVMCNYATSDAPPRGPAGKVAKYARGRDYHRALVPALAALSKYIDELGGPGTRSRWFVDAGPVPERELAQRAGLGWIGKNTMLIRPGTGSFTLIGSVFTTADLAPDAPFTADRCGSCTRCLDACPTAAFPAERVLDARRCIAYLTIEFRDEVPGELASRMGAWIFGCDVCQEVCPWNEKFARSSAVPLLALDSARTWIPLDAFAALDETTFDLEYGWTPLERPGLEGMRRNAAIVALNVGEDTDDGFVQIP